MIISTLHGVGLLCGDTEKDQAEFHESSQLQNSGAPKSVLLCLQIAIISDEEHFQYPRDSYGTLRLSAWCCPSVYRGRITLRLKH